MEFINWIREKIAENELTYEEFGKMAGFSKSHISLVMSGQRSVTPRFCNGVAKVFGLDSVKVLGLAGLLELKEEKPDYKTEDYIILFQKLSPQEREKAICFIKFLLSEYSKP